MFGWLVSLAIVVTITVLADGNNPPKPNTAPSLASLAVKSPSAPAGRARDQAAAAGWDRPKKAEEAAEVAGARGQHVPVVRHGPGSCAAARALIGAGAATVVEAKLSSWETYLVLFLFCVLGSASYIALVVYAGFRPGPSQALLARFRTWMETHTDQVIIFGSLITRFLADRQQHLPDRQLRAPQSGPDGSPGVLARDFDGATRRPERDNGAVTSFARTRRAGRNGGNSQ